jgi:serine/threonine protein kinase/Tol biopolymer transport system component
MSKAEKKNDRPPGEDELTSTASFGGSAVRPGGHVGPYKLLTTLGEGGFAVVYLAEQEKPIRRRVALKVLKPGMDSKQIIARFEAERQALALLDHPNVAHVYDAGTTKHGLPYFAMEHVRGLPLTEHCDRHKLTVEERLKLFLRVCEAVQHAHHKGIIHRDIKPSNIQVKVIDFGVAKALSQPLTERTLVTEQGQMVGTPEYMSPEQAEMTSQDIDTRTDIYSLGVLLYKLLVGTLPFKSETLREGGIDHVRQVICEESPKTPSIQVSSLNVEESTKVAQCCRTDVNALRRRVSGDLDWIILKAMEKDRTRRYQTAHALAEDIQRHLNHEPVLAGPPSKIYRLKKFLRKHRAQAIRTAMTVILLAGITAIFVMYRRAANRAEDAESLINHGILLKAEQLRSDGQFENALDELETVLNSEHFGPEARLLHARLVLQLRGPDDAIKELDKLLNETRRNEIACQAHFLLARIYRESAADEGDTARIYKRKMNEHKQKGEALSPNNAEAFFDRAMIAGTVRETLEYLDKAVDLDRSHYDSLKSRALAYHALRDYRKMWMDACAMIVLRQQDPLGYSLRAIASRETGDFDDAIECNNKAIELSSDDDPELYSQRYETYLRMGDYQAALKDAQRCVKIEPERFIYCFNLFTTSVSLKRYEDARQQYRKIARAGRQQQFEACVRRHVFKVLGAGELLELSADIAREEAFFAMQGAADYYRDLAANARRLAPGVYGQSSWSPDGRELAYGRSGLYPWQPKTLMAGAPPVSGAGGIEIYDLESNTTRPLASFGKDPAWSPDGEYIAFVREPYGVREYKEEVWIIPAAGGEPRRLAEGGWPIWASDSRRLFYHSREQKALQSIRTDDLAAKPEHIIGCPSKFPGVSPDGKYIAYNKGNVLKIVEIASDSVVTTWVAPEPVTVLLVRWKSDGKELSVAGPGTSGLGLWIFDVERRKAWQIFEKPAISGIWSPDSSRMVVEIKTPFEENWLVTIEPNMPTYRSIASARTQEDYLQERREHYKDRIKSDPDKANIYLRKLVSVSRSQNRIGVYEDALETLTTVEKLRHETSPPDVALTVKVLHQVGRKQEAQATLDRLRSLFEDGERLFAEKYLYEAEQFLADKNSTVYRIWEYVKTEQLKEASQLVEKLRRLPPEPDTELGRCFESVVSALARAYYRRGRRARDSSYTETIADYEAAVLVNPNLARAYADLAWLQAAYPKADFHNRPRAIKNATDACELTGWNDYRYISTLADVHARLGDFDNAVKWQQKAIDLLPEDESQVPKAGYEEQLELYKSGRPYDKGNPRSFSTGRMVAWWKFDENSGNATADSSGNGHNGELVGNPKWQPSGGKFGGALDCDGDGDYIEIGHESSFDFRNEITVAAWVNITKVPVEWTPIVTKGNSTWRLVTYRAERRFHFAVADPTVSSSGVFGTTEVAAGEWHHVAGTYDGATIRLYVDGRQEPDSKRYGDGLTANNCDVFIGGNSEKPERSWHGLIDDVRIYGYALSEAEIKALYAGQGSGPAED